MPLDRARLRAAFETLTERALLANPKALIRIVNALSVHDGEDWLYHVTDDIFRCALCGMQDGHYSTCLTHEFRELARSL